jgi:hypothetical protein
VSAENKFAHNSPRNMQRKQVCAQRPLQRAAQTSLRTTALATCSANKFVHNSPRNVQRKQVCAQQPLLRTAQTSLRTTALATCSANKFAHNSPRNVQRKQVCAQQPLLRTAQTSLRTTANNIQKNYYFYTKRVIRLRFAAITKSTCYATVICPFSWVQ